MLLCFFYRFTVSILNLYYTSPVYQRGFGKVFSIHPQIRFQKRGVTVLKYRMSAASLNRWSTPGKKTDGAGLFWIRNINGSLTAKQRVKNKDIKIDTFNGKLTPASLNKVRQIGVNLKTSPIQNQNSTVFLSPESKLSEAWEDFYLIMTSSSNSSWSPYTAKQNKNRIETYIKPTGIWDMQVQHIHVAELFAVLKSVRQEKHNTESKIRGVLSKVFTHLLSMRLINDNPVLSLPALYRNLEKPKKAEHLPAELFIDQLGKILHDNDYSPGSFLVKKAVELQAYTCQRSLEVAGAIWSEIDFDSGIWTISRHRMKVKLRNYDQVLHLGLLTRDT